MASSSCPSREFWTIRSRSRDRKLPGPKKGTAYAGAPFISPFLIPALVPGSVHQRGEFDPAVARAVFGRVVRDDWTVLTITDSNQLILRNTLVLQPGDDRRRATFADRLVLRVAADGVGVSRDFKRHRRAARNDILEVLKKRNALVIKPRAAGCEKDIPRPRQDLETSKAFFLGHHALGLERNRCGGQDRVGQIGGRSLLGPAENEVEADHTHRCDVHIRRLLQLRPAFFQIKLFQRVRNR